MISFILLIKENINLETKWSTIVKTLYSDETTSPYFYITEKKEDYFNKELAKAAIQAMSSLSNIPYVSNKKNVITITSIKNQERYIIVKLMPNNQIIQQGPADSNLLLLTNQAKQLVNEQNVWITPTFHPFFFNKKTDVRF